MSSAEHRTLSHQQARAFYDRFGAKQDWQRFHEDPAVQRLIRHADVDAATAVIEFGCGTGRIAETLLREHLPASATYIGVDVSATMVNLARTRLRPFGDRAAVQLTDGAPHIAARSGQFDRFVTTYVMDLLSVDDIRAVIGEAHRLLKPHGLLGVVSLTHGGTALARFVERLWMRVHAWRPALVGGCRAVTLPPFLVSQRWQIRHHSTVTTFTITSEVVVAARQP